MVIEKTVQFFYVRVAFKGKYKKGGIDREKSNDLITIVVSHYYLHSDYYNLLQ